MSMKVTVIWDVGVLRRVVSRIALMMEAVSTSETSVSFYETTWRNIAEDTHFLDWSYSAQDGRAYLYEYVGETFDSLTQNIWTSWMAMNSEGKSCVVK
jgi:hypothetical protein